MRGGVENQMNEDFRAKSIGCPTAGNLARRDYLTCSAERKKEREAFERERDRRLKGRIHRPLFGAKISDDHGESWKLYCLCGECVASIEPPRRCRNEGAAGALACDWCGALNDDSYKNK